VRPPSVSGQSEDVSPGTNRSHSGRSGDDEWVTGRELLGVLTRSRDRHRLHRFPLLVEERPGHDETTIGVPLPRPGNVLRERFARNLFYRGVIDLKKDDVERSLH
jgi:hypothetical protein